MYSGPKLSSCPNVVWTWTTAAGAAIPFLSSTWNPTTLEMGIVLANSASAIKGTYVISASFTQPGVKINPTGLTLIVQNLCDSTVFPSAPTMSPTASTYYYGTGNLAVSVSYALDSSLCGNYIIQITLDTAASTITGGPVNSALITTSQTTANSFNFNAN